MAGGSLIGKIHKAFKEFDKVGLIDGSASRQDSRRPGDRLQSDHAHGQERGLEGHRPSASRTRSPRSLAIGDPADGFFASKVIRDTGGWGEDVDDDAIAEAMTLLAGPKASGPRPPAASPWPSPAS